MKKILFMGIDSSTAFALRYAKSRGIYTIITDYKSTEDSPLKLEADEYWMLNVADLDALEQKCREEHIDGVYSGSHEFCLDHTKMLTKRLGLPFYASEKGWTVARNKAMFKDLCLESGLDTAKRYMVTDDFDPAVLAAIEYPVIVKPTDSSAQRGFAVCHNEEELKSGYLRAKQFSKSGVIIVEDFIDGVEQDINIYVDNGVAHFVNMDDKMMVQVNDKPNQTILPIDSIYYDEFIQLMPKIQTFIEKLDWVDGYLFFQTIYRDGKFYFLEMGGRIDGVGHWTVVTPVFGFDYIGRMVDLAMGEKPVIDWDALDFNPKGCHSSLYLFWARPGKVSDVRGVAEVEALGGITFAMKRFRPGDEVKKTDNLLQVGWYIGICAKSGQELADKIRFINEHLLVLDENGENLMINYTDYDHIAATY